MAKPDKKSSKKLQKKTKTKSAAAAKPEGRLIALEGTSGVLLRTEAERLARLCGGEDGPAWSMWDASNTFYEMRMAKAKKLTPTPRTLLLLYASDLLFRLRWEIVPAMTEGRSVVAAPYVETAMAFGLVADLPREWLEELFRFAPKPAQAFRLKEKKKSGDKKKDAHTASGFVEFCCVSLAKHYPGWEMADVRTAMLKYLKGLEEQDQIKAFGKKGPRKK